MIVYHANCLHKCIADDGADKLETVFKQVFAHCIGLLSVGWNIFNSFDFVIDRPAVYKLPDIYIESTEFFLNFQKCFGILDRRCNLQAITDNPWISKESIYFFLPITSDFVRMEAIKCPAVVFTFL